jgi:2-octaprenyl-6-methoxyphenol hydroxylase
MSLGSGQHLRAALLVAADGARSALRDMAGIRAQVWPSAKTGIAVTLSAERPHGGIARQHFLPAGPVALLPMTRNRISLIWTEGAKTAAALLAEPEEKLTAEIMQRAGPDLGALALLNKPASYPLTMTLARDYVRPRFALIGDAAHALHWIAGQGLNHGLKDVAALAETLCDASSLGLDLGSLSVLQRYERWRRFDSVTSAVTASALNGLFSNDSAVLRFVRSSGMSAVERVGPLKTLLMREAAGLSGTPPKLMRGEHL